MKLWNNNVLLLSQVLWEAFGCTLISEDSLAQCCDGSTDKGIHGGKNDDDALEHFVYRFPTSSSRLCYLIANPQGTLTAISEAVLASFSSGQIVILDLAGGTGAGTIGMLTTIAELRREQIVPTLPIQVRIYAADFSRKALLIYQKMIENVYTDLKS